VPTRRPLPRPPIAPLLAALLCAAPLVRAGAQSLSAGSVAGDVRAASGDRLGETTLTLIDRTTGVRRTARTRLEGAFRFLALPPGEYDLTAERLGFRVQRVVGVPVHAGAMLRVAVRLETAGTGTMAIDTVLFRGAPAGGTLGAALASSGLSDLADPRELATAAASLLPGAGPDLGYEGLPGRLGAIAVDGVVRSSPRHPRLAGAVLDGLTFVPASLAGAEMLGGGRDAEWPGAGGGVLSLATLRGSRTLGLRAGLDYSGAGPRAVAVLSGPIVNDTAHFAIGVAYRRLEHDLPAPWRSDSIAFALDTVARDSFATDASAYLRPVRDRTELASAFGRLDWQIAQAHQVSLRASAGTARIREPELGEYAAPAVGSSLEATELSATVALTSTLGSRAASELRVAVDAGRHEYVAAPLPLTRMVEPGLSLGAAATTPGRFTRSTVRVAETVHVRLGAHEAKIGLALGFTNHDQTYADDRNGTFTFSGPIELAQRTGAFRQTVGLAPLSSFAVRDFTLFLQGLLRPSADLEIALGLHGAREALPTADVRQNAGWLQATGIDNAALPRARLRVAPRAGLSWSAGPRREWRVEVEAALHHDGTDPGLMAEILTLAGGVRVRRALGALNAWPNLPDSASAPVRGEALSLLGPSYQPPRHGRLAAGITRSFGRTVARVSGAYRHTDFLPRRRELNLPVVTRRDQFGRSVYGTLAQSGAVLGPMPGTNRRFTAFDAVSALEPTGASDYYGLSVQLEREAARGLSLMARYTFSRTTDNWFGARDGTAQGTVLPFADTVGGAEWARGRSDFDAPHRVTLGTELRFAGRSGMRLAVLWRWRSGLPFTPGSRDGVDANGDGSDRNDPAFVSDSVAGAAAVIAASDCLRRQIGRFAERNSCREPGVSDLDIRAAFRLFRMGGAETELVVDGLGVLDPDRAIVDRALYVVDRSGTITTSTTGGITRYTVPLVANPNFGLPLVRRNLGATWRVGLRVSH